MRGRPGKRILQRTLLQTCKGPTILWHVEGLGPYGFYSMAPDRPDSIRNMPTKACMHACMQSGACVRACRGRPAYEQGRQNSPTLPLHAGPMGCLWGMLRIESALLYIGQAAGSGRPLTLTNPYTSAPPIEFEGTGSPPHRIVGHIGWGGQCRGWGYGSVGSMPTVSERIILKKRV